jgi:hypothetical protein
VEFTAKFLNQISYSFYRCVESRAQLHPVCVRLKTIGLLTVGCFTCFVGIITDYRFDIHGYNPNFAGCQLTAHPSTRQNRRQTRQLVSGGVSDSSESTLTESSDSSLVSESSDSSLTHSSLSRQSKSVCVAYPRIDVGEEWREVGCRPAQRTQATRCHASTGSASARRFQPSAVTCDR